MSGSVQGSLGVLQTYFPFFGCMSALEKMYKSRRAGIWMRTCTCSKVERAFASGCGGVLLLVLRRMLC
jgi:hypothetical protein